MNTQNEDKKYKEKRIELNIKFNFNKNIPSPNKKNVPFFKKLIKLLRKN